jgi:hypothetical protein
MVEGAFRFFVTLADPGMIFSRREEKHNRALFLPAPDTICMSRWGDSFARGTAPVVWETVPMALSL